jgi:transposase InsO family protein
MNVEISPPPEIISRIAIVSLFPPDENAAELPVELVTGEPERSRKQKRADEFDAKHVEIISERSLLISLMNSGLSAKDALARVPLKRPLTVSALLKLRTRYQKEGAEALVDRRWSRETEVTVLTGEVRKLIEYYFLEIAGGPKAVWKEVCAKLKRIQEKEGRKIRPPSYSVTKAYIASLPEAIKLLKKGKAGIREWEKQGAPVGTLNTTRFSNQLWQADHCFLPLWGKKKIKGIWRPVLVYFSDTFDDFSRAIPGFVTSARYPDRETVKLLYRFSILPKKNKKWKIQARPYGIKTDRGKDLISADVRASLRLLEIEPDPNPAHYPNANGKIERFHRTLNECCLKRLPGHMAKIGTTIQAAEKNLDELLTVPQIRAEIECWIVDDYHQSTHSETGRKPAELWEETVRFRSVEQHDDALNLLMLRDGVTRTVRNTGIDFTLDGIKHRYWSPECAHYWHSKVVLAHWPDDMESVLVYLAETGEYLFEAWDLRSEDPRYTPADIKACRSEFRRGLKQRLKGHFEDAETDDRPFKVAKMYEQIREQANQESASLPPDNAPAESKPVDDSIIDLANQIRQARWRTLVTQEVEQEHVF